MKIDGKGLDEIVYDFKKNAWCFYEENQCVIVCDRKSIHRMTVVIP